MKACCGFGHRNIFENIGDRLDSAVETAIQQGCEIFYTGAMGERAKTIYPHIRLICVKPYFTNDINTDRDYYHAMYDDVIIPPEIIGVHYKAAIKARNRRMIDNSDVVLIYTVRNYGGAYDARKYAERQDKYVIEI